MTKKLKNSYLFYCSYCCCLGVLGGGGGGGGGAHVAFRSIEQSKYIDEELFFYSNKQGKANMN